MNRIWCQDDFSLMIGEASLASYLGARFASGSVMGQIYSFLVFPWKFLVNSRLVTQKRFCFSVGKILLCIGKLVSVTGAVVKIYCDVIVKALTGFMMLTGTTCRQIPG